MKECINVHGVHPDAQVLDVGDELVALDGEERADVDGVVNAAACAAYNGHLDVVRYLHARGADMDLADRRGWSVVHSAAAGGQLEVLRFLAQSGANMHCLYRGSESYAEAPIDLVPMFEVDQRTEDILSFLILHGGELSLPPSELRERHKTDDVPGLKKAVSVGLHRRTSLQKSTLLALLEIDTLPCDVANVITRFARF